MRLITFIFLSFTLGACAKEYSCENCQPKEPLGPKFLIEYNGPWKMLQGGETPNILKLKSMDVLHPSLTISNVYPGHWDDPKYQAGETFQFQKRKYKVYEHNFYYAFGTMEALPVFWFQGDPGIDSVIFVVEYDTTWRTRFRDTLSFN